MNMSRYFFFILFSLMLVAGCINKPNFSVIPAITYEGVNSTFVVSGQDSLIFQIDFEDGDGDLGSDNADTTVNAFMIDSRTGFPVSYKIPYISPKGTTEAISGSIWFTLVPFAIACRPDHPDMDTVTYQIYIVDRAGNESNRVFTDQIIIDCN